MSITLDHTRLLDRPAERVVHDVASRLLDKAAAAGRRLERADDHEALHDFRVALRRLRTWLKAYGARLKVGDKLQAPLADIMHTTNGARDAEVGLAWLNSQRRTFNEDQLVGLNWFAAQLEQERRHAYHVIVTHVPGQWLQQASRLRKRLDKAADLPSHEAAFAPVAGAQIVEYAEQLAARVADVNTLTDLPSAHKARISAKHLRYLLEPLRHEAPDAEGLVAELADLQDQLGALHDAGVMLDRLIDATETAAMEDARYLLAQVLRDGFEERCLPMMSHQDARPGLLLLTYRAKHHETLLFEEILERLHATATVRLFDRARTLGESLLSASFQH